MRSELHVYELQNTKLILTIANNPLSFMFLRYAYNKTDGKLQIYLYLQYLILLLSLFYFLHQKMRHIPLLLALLSYIPVTQSITCTNDFTLVGNKCWRLFTTPTSRTNASRTCAEYAGNLVTIRNHDVRFQFLAILMKFRHSGQFSSLRLCWKLY